MQYVLVELRSEPVLVYFSPEFLTSHAMQHPVAIAPKNSAPPVGMPIIAKGAERKNHITKETISTNILFSSFFFIEERHGVKKY